MALADAIRPALDKIRGIGGLLGLRPLTVTVTVRTWTGTRAGLGTSSDVTTTLLVNGQNPIVKLVSPADVIASGGKLTAGHYLVGPLTPTFTGGGYAPSAMDPAAVGPAVEVLWRVSGVCLPAGGVECERVSGDTSSALHYSVELRRTGRSR